MLKRYFYLILTLLWMILIYCMSAKTADASSSDSMFITDYIIKFFVDNPSQTLLDTFETLIRKLAHFTEYAILSLLMCMSMNSFGVKRKNIVLSLVFAFVYAVSDEVHQYFVPGRACRVLDMIIDTAGAAFGYGVYMLFSRITKKPK